VGITGTLASIGVQIFRGSGITSSSPGVILEIHPNSPADPTILGTYTISPLAVPTQAHPTPTFVSVDVWAANIAVNAGDVFAIVARSSSTLSTTGYLWAKTPTGINDFNGPSYPDGNTWNFIASMRTRKQETDAGR
jgi:hypothetical protein